MVQLLQIVYLYIRTDNEKMLTNFGIIRAKDRRKMQIVNLPHFPCQLHFSHLTAARPNCWQKNSKCPNVDFTSQQLVRKTFRIFTQTFRMFDKHFTGHSQCSCSKSPMSKTFQTKLETFTDISKKLKLSKTIQRSFSMQL